MRKLLLAVPLSLLCLAVHRAHANDYPALPDAGSLVTSAGGAPGDGGGPWVTVDTGQVQDWTMVIRCSSRLGSPRVHYLLSADAGTATAANQLLDLDRTFDIPVTQTRGQKFRHLSLLGEDGGPPACSIQTPIPPP